MAVLPPYAQYLVRLLAADADELLADQQPSLRVRVATLRKQVCFELRTRARLSAASARRKIGHLLARLLRLACCRRTIRQTVPLPEALGPVALLNWDTEAESTRTHWEIVPWEEVLLHPYAAYSAFGEVTAAVFNDLRVGFAGSEG